MLCQDIKFRDKHADISMFYMIKHPDVFLYTSGYFDPYIRISSNNTLLNIHSYYFGNKVYFIHSSIRLLRLPVGVSARGGQMTRVYSICLVNYSNLMEMFILSVYSTSFYYPNLSAYLQNK